MEVLHGVIIVLVIILIGYILWNLMAYNSNDNVVFMYDMSTRRPEIYDFCECGGTCNKCNGLFIKNCLCDVPCDCELERGCFCGGNCDECRLHRALITHKLEQKAIQKYMKNSQCGISHSFNTDSNNDDFGISESRIDPDGLNIKRLHMTTYTLRRHMKGEQFNVPKMRNAHNGGVSFEHFGVESLDGVLTDCDA